MLKKLRKKIDTIDNKILKLLEKRITFAEEMKKIKKGIMWKPEREEEIIINLTNKATKLQNKEIKNIWRSIIMTTLNREEKLSINIYLDNEENKMTIYNTVRKHFGFDVEIEEIKDFPREINTKTLYICEITKNPSKKPFWLQIEEKKVPLYINANLEEKIKLVIFAQNKPNINSLGKKYFITDKANQANIVSHYKEKYLVVFDKILKNATFIGRKN